MVIKNILWEDLLLSVEAAKLCTLGYTRLVVPMAGLNWVTENRKYVRELGSRKGGTDGQRKAILALGWTRVPHAEE